MKEIVCGSPGQLAVAIETLIAHSATPICGAESRFLVIEVTEPHVWPVKVWIGLLSASGENGRMK